MKKLTVILMILFVGILFAGCTSQPATPAATTAPTAAPTEATTAPTAAPTEAPTAAPTTEVTTATPTPTPTPIPDYKILIAKTLTFDPCVVTAPAGTKIIWYTDATGYKFKVSANGPATIISDIIQPGHSWSYTFTKPGTYTASEMIYQQFRDDDCKIIIT